MAEAEAAHAAHDILQVLAECHRKGICYADVKPANFLLTRPYRRSGKGDDSRLLELRTTDFGCSQRIQEVRVCHCGTAAIPQLRRCELSGGACFTGIAKSLDLCAASQSGKLNKRTGTPLYMAPELFMRYYGVESDQVITAVPCKSLLCNAMRSCCRFSVEYTTLK